MEMNVQTNKQTIGKKGQTTTTTNAELQLPLSLFNVVITMVFDW